MNIRTHSYHKHPYSNCMGFTLVEAMVGLVILALGLLSLARFQVGLIESSGLTKARTAAINHGQNKMEELRNMISKGEFITIDTSTDPDTYSVGSLVAGGNDAAVTITNESFTRSWLVTNWPTSETADHQADIQVTVAWEDANAIPGTPNQQIVLASKIAWLDPGSSSTSTTSTTSFTPTIPFPSGNATVGDGTSTYDTSSLPPIPENDDSADSDTIGDGTRTVTDADGVNYLVDSNDVILLQSTNAFTTIRGIIALDTTASPAIQTLPADFALMDIVASDAGHCVFPLIFSSDQEFDGEPENDNTVTIARYTCYVAEGWYGGIGVFNHDANDDVCPAITRTYRGLSFAADGTTIVGVFGLTVLTAQSEDDFVVTKLGGSDTCDNIPLPTGITDTDGDPSNLPGPLEGIDVIVSTQSGTITISGAVTIDKTSTPFAGSTFPGLTLTSVSDPTNSASDGTCTGVTDTGSGYGTFSCTLDAGWAGKITLTADDASDKVCIGGIGTIGLAVNTHSAAELSSITGENFDIVEGSGIVSCP